MIFLDRLRMESGIEIGIWILVICITDNTINALPVFGLGGTKITHPIDVLVSTAVNEIMILLIVDLKTEFIAITVSHTVTRHVYANMKSSN